MVNPDNDPRPEDLPPSNLDLQRKLEGDTSSSKSSSNSKSQSRNDQSRLRTTVDPLLLAKELWPDVMFYREQREIIYSVWHNDETFVPAGNMLGKDFVAGFIALAFFLTRSPCRVISTSVDHAQLEGVLWGEIRRFVQTCKYPLEAQNGGPLICNHLHIRKVDPKTLQVDPLSYLIGRVASKGEGMLGHHIAKTGDGIPRTLFIADEACHDSKTEVLTNQGWKLFSSLQGNELFLSMDPLTRIADYYPATSIHRNHYCGKMYLYERRAGNFCVTPNHKMLWQRVLKTSTQSRSRYYLQSIEKGIHKLSTGRYIPRCFNWIGWEQDKFVLPGMDMERKRYGDWELPMREWVEFLGWYIAEGNCSYHREHPGSVTISQKDPVTLGYIASLAEKLGFFPRVYTNVQSPCVRINDRHLAQWLHDHCKRYSFNKIVPEFIGNLSPSLIEVFLQAFKEGDGYDRDSGREILYTSSRSLADQLQILSYKAGRESTIHKRSLIGLPAPNGFSRRDGYVVSRSRIGLDSHLKINPTYLQLIDYIGEVFCATVPPYHTLFTRREGVCMWSGNSGVDDISYERADTWADRKLVIGNPYDCQNFFRRGVEGGDILAKV